MIRPRTRARAGDGTELVELGSDGRVRAVKRARLHRSPSAARARSPRRRSSSSSAASMSRADVFAEAKEAKSKRRPNPPRKPIEAVRPPSPALLLPSPSCLSSAVVPVPIAAIPPHVALVALASPRPLGGACAPKSRSKPRPASLPPALPLPPAVVAAERATPPAGARERDKDSAATRSASHGVGTGTTPHAAAASPCLAPSAAPPAAPAATATSAAVPPPWPSHVATWQVATWTVGSGTYGEVRKCWATVGGVRHLCAHKQQREHAWDDDEGLRVDTLREMQALCSVPPHPCVVRAHAVVMHMGTPRFFLPLFSSHLSAALSHMPRTERVLAAIAVQLLAGLQHLHAHGFLHRDIKLENALVHADGTVALSDLGLCRRIMQEGEGPPSAEGDAEGDAKRAHVAHMDVTGPQTNNVCTLWTRAPEVCLRITGAPSTALYGPASDVWSLGATLLACAAGTYVIKGGGDSDLLVNIWRLLGKPPHAVWPLLAKADSCGGNAFAALPTAAFPHYDRPSVVHAKLRTAAKRADLSDAACAFLRRLLEQVPERRATTAEALTDPFLAAEGLDGSLGGLERARTILREAWSVKAPTPPATTAVRAPVLSPEFATLWTSATPPRTLPAWTYMAGQLDINVKMRAILLDWLWEVGIKFKLVPAVFLDTVQIIDAYLDRTAIIRQRLQLLGVAAMLLVCKLSEVYAPELRDFVYITDKAYTREQIMAQEISIVEELGAVVLPRREDRLHAHVAALITPQVLGGIASVTTPPPSLRCALAALCVCPNTMQWTVAKPAVAVAAAAYMAWFLDRDVVAAHPKLLALASAVAPHVPPCEPGTSPALVEGVGVGGAGAGEGEADPIATEAAECIERLRCWLRTSTPPLLATWRADRRSSDRSDRSDRRTDDYSKSDAFRQLFGSVPCPAPPPVP